MKPCALITGASSGIGRGLAFEFSKHGFDLILISRNLTELNQIKSQIESTGSSKVKTIACDLSKIDQVQNLAHALQPEFKNISTLVHNAGIGSHGDFENTKLESELDLATIQVQSTLILTKYFLKFRDHNIKTQMMNISSVYSYVPVPHQAVYAACKAFLWSFGDGIANEGHKNFSVTTVFPGSTRTEFRKRMGINESKKLTGMSAEEVAEIAVKGLLANKKYIVPGFTNWVFIFVASWLPRKLAIQLILKINSARLRNHH